MASIDSPNSTISSHSRKAPRKPTKVDVGFTLLLALASLVFVLTRPLYAENTITVERHGNPDGRALVLIPGLACGGDVWDATVEEFSKTHDLHVVTLAGFAGAEPLDDVAANDPEALKGLFLERVRDAVIRHLCETGVEHPVLIGHSLGAFVSYSVASHDPGLVGGVIAVDGLPFLGALQNPAATAETMQPIAAQMRTMMAGVDPEQFARNNEMTLRTMIRDAAEIERIAATSGLSDPATVGQAMVELMTTDLRPELARIEAPVLQIGAFGGLPSDEMKALMTERYGSQIAQAPQAEFVAADTLHFVMLDDPEKFHQLVRTFLDDLADTETSSAGSSVTSAEEAR